MSKLWHGLVWWKTQWVELASGIQGLVCGGWVLFDQGAHVVGGPVIELLVATVLLAYGSFQCAILAVQYQKRTPANVRLCREAMLWGTAIWAGLFVGHFVAPLCVMPAWMLAVAAALCLWTSTHLEGRFG